eukprot:Rhum_TRINITY_DN14000_c6_g1::Rhum_TRINITY_DN14000_c6_g1_i1::g.67374::m.67374
MRAPPLHSTHARHRFYKRVAFGAAVAAAALLANAVVWLRDAPTPAPPLPTSPFSSPSLSTRRRPAAAEGSAADALPCAPGVPAVCGAAGPLGGHLRTAFAALRLDPPLQRAAASEPRALDVAPSAAAPAAPSAFFDLVLNLGRKKKRRTKSWAAAPSLAAPFDPTQFNFHKADPSEMLFAFDAALAGCACGAAAAPEAEHAVFVNRFPLGNHSGLLAPHFRRNLSQSLDGRRDAIEAALRFAGALAAAPAASAGGGGGGAVAAAAHARLRVGFNSLAAGASVNHLHFQFWEYAGARAGLMPVEWAKKVAGNDGGGGGFRAIARSARGAMLREIGEADFQLTGFVVEGCGGSGGGVQAAAAVLARAASWLTRHEVPYNMLLNGEDAYLVPRRPTSAESMIRGALPPGFPEVFGEVVCIDEVHMTLTGAELAEHYVTHLRASSADIAALREELLATPGWSPFSQ